MKQVPVERGPERLACHLALLGQDLGHRGEDSLPISPLLHQLGAAVRRDGVDLDAASGFEFAPIALNPALFGEAVKGRKERAGTNDKGAARDLLNTVGDGDTV